jgi:hypothetical protein
MVAVRRDNEPTAEDSLAVVTAITRSILSRLFESQFILEALEVAGAVVLHGTDS